MQKIKILGGHDLSRARSNLVVIGLGDQGSNVRLTYTNNGHNCDLRINSEALSASEELEVTIAVPGHGKTTRFFKIADSSNFDLEFLAVIPRR